MVIFLVFLHTGQIPKSTDDLHYSSKSSILQFAQDLIERIQPSTFACEENLVEEFDNITAKSLNEELNINISSITSLPMIKLSS